MYAIMNVLDSVVDAGHSIVNANHVIRNFLDFVVDGTGNLQDLRSGHSGLLLRQPV
jgi:hypothetical protein